MYVFDLYQSRSRRRKVTQGLLGGGVGEKMTIDKLFVFEVCIALYVTVYKQFSAASRLETVRTAHPQQAGDFLHPLQMKPP